MITNHLDKMKQTFMRNMKIGMQTIKKEVIN